VHLSLYFPSLSDWGGMFVYVLGNPDLFIRQSTVMTGAIGLLAATLTYSWRPRFLTRFLEAVTPTLIVILVIFSLGSLALSIEIWLRFHDSLPYECGVQLVSGAGHFVLGTVLIRALWPWVGRVSRRSWIKARLAGGVYWSLQVSLIEPEWFSFQGQRALILGVFWIGMIIYFILNYDCWRALNGQKSLFGPLPREVEEG